MRIFKPSLLLGLLACLSFSAIGKGLPSLKALGEEAEVANWEKGITTSIIIEAPLNEVWDYVSDSTKATEWSVFFDHISPLPGVQDGKLGAMRRCYRLADENGPHWDEMTIEVEPRLYRLITTYNLSGFRFSSFVRGNYAFVKQVYRPIDEDTTELTFQTVAAPSSGWKSKLAFSITSKETRRIFNENLENIKAAIEGQPRPHPWK